MWLAKNATTLLQVTYQPGTHIIASLQTANDAALRTYVPVKELLQHLIEQHQLTQLGEVYHNFSGGGFTAIICLSESHLSLHTWPEHQLVNLDIYLSNYQRNNDGTVLRLFEALCIFFQATILQKQTILR